MIQYQLPYDLLQKANYLYVNMCVYIKNDNNLHHHINNIMIDLLFNNHGLFQLIHHQINSLIYNNNILQIFFNKNKFELDRGEICSLLVNSNSTNEFKISDDIKTIYSCFANMIWTHVDKHYILDTINVKIKLNCDMIVQNLQNAINDLDDMYDYLLQETNSIKKKSFLYSKFIALILNFIMTDNIPNKYRFFILSRMKSLLKLKAVNRKMPENSYFSNFIEWINIQKGITTVNVDKWSGFLLTLRNSLNKDIFLFSAKDISIIEKLLKLISTNENSVVYHLSQLQELNSTIVHNKYLSSLLDKQFKNHEDKKQAQIELLKIRNVNIKLINNWMDNYLSKITDLNDINSEQKSYVLNIKGLDTKVM